MGTRAAITFEDDMGKFTIYQHWDGDPDTIMQNLSTVKKCWDFPRWEADEFGAAYIATHKTGSGNIRLSRGHTAHGDLSYSYNVKLAGNALQIDVYKPGRKLINTRFIDLNQKQAA